MWRRTGARFVLTIVGLLVTLLSGCQRRGAPPGAVAARAAEPCLAPSADGGDGGGGGIAFPYSRFDLCGNGVDDDGDGVLDQGCVCGTSEVVRCFPGDVSLAGVGACSWGETECGGTTWGSCEGAGTGSTEACNGIDDDCDRAVDEGCPCDVGDTQPCFAGSAAQRGVGACADGAQTCEAIDTIDGLPVGGWGLCVGARGAAGETCNALDDDCDGVVDEIAERCDGGDNDCDGAVDEDERCQPSDGNAMALTRFWPPTASGVFTDTTTPLHTLVATPADPCPDGLVLYEVDYGVLACVPPPIDDCPPLTQPVYRDGAWGCEDCEALVQYGSLFDFERVCTSLPRLVCPEGQVPTFDESLAHWVCARTCNNTTYDHAWIRGELVCVPC